MLEPLTVDPEVIWQPQSEPQAVFLRCPFFEVLYEGERFAGKSDALLGSFLSEVGQGWGADWRGILFRPTYPELGEILKRSRELFTPLGGEFRASGPEGFSWRFPQGETLLLRHARRAEDTQLYLSHSYPWVGWNELTRWPSPAAYEAMLACCRSAREGIPKMIRADCNPWGPGTNWVRERFVDPMPERVPLAFTFHNPITNEDVTLHRCRVHGYMADNKIGVRNNPEYAAQIQMVSDPDKRRAWFGSLYGTHGWDITGGNFFAGCWRDSCHWVEPFELPKGWTVDRCFDWGSAHPFWVGWNAEANGEEVEVKHPKTGKRLRYKFPRGTLFLVAEWYGWNGRADQGCHMASPAIAKGIREREAALAGHILNGNRVLDGPADNQIFLRSPDSESIADVMGRAGVRWTESDKSPGSRINGWQLMREMLEAALPFEKLEPMEAPGLFVFNTCGHFRRTLQAAPRDERKPDDVDTDCEDHPLDGQRYRVLAGGPAIIKTTFRRRL